MCKYHINKGNACLFFQFVIFFRQIFQNKTFMNFHHNCKARDIKGENLYLKAYYVLNNGLATEMKKNACIKDLP